MAGTISAMFRNICGLVDSIIYILISGLEDLFTTVSNIVLYSDTAIETIGKRIGLILGIVMLFRVAISLISYLISPDTISDNAKGGSKIIKNAIFSFILLVTINPIFKEAYKIQIKVVESNFIEKIFFGPKAEVEKIDLAYSLYTQFVTPRIEECSEMFDPVVGITEDCANRLQSITNRNTIGIITDVIETHKFNYLLMSYDAMNYKINGDYIFDYFMIVSTIAGAVVALMLISFCMDLATRAIKLLFLQIIAPIPIIANIDPNKGSEAFKKWGKECINTYVGLFIRIIAINFAVFMITLIRSEFHEVFAGKGPLLIVLIIIGCLMFAKQVPKLIEDITGIKSEGFTLNPIKKFEEQALFGKQITGAARGIGKAAVAGTIGAATGAAGATIASRKLNETPGQSTWAFFRGAGRGLISAAGKGAKAKNTFEAVKGSSRLGKEADYVNSLDGTTFGGRVKAWGQQRLHVATDYDIKGKVIEKIKFSEQEADAALKRAESESVKYNNLTIKYKHERYNKQTGKMETVDDLSMSEHKQMQEKLTRLRNEIVDREHFMKTNEKSVSVKQEWEANNLSKYTTNDGEVDWERANEEYRKYLATHQDVQRNLDIEFEKYAAEHDKQIQELNDAVNINAKKFAESYIDAVETKTLKKVDKDGNAVLDEHGNEIIVSDDETLGHLHQAEIYADKAKEIAKEKLDEKFIKENKINDINYGTVGKRKTKDAKQAAIVARQSIESNFEGTGAAAYNPYTRDKLNAEATKPGKGS